MGARVWVPDGIDPFVFLFSESQARAIVAVPRSEEVRFTDMCTARRFPHQRIGVVDDGADGGPVLDVQEQFTLPLDELRVAHEETFPARFDN
jgi:phosphoribosylformylglycinamidine synthase